MSVWVGTSGFSYKEWKKNFYPSDLPADQFLSHYATRLNGVEIDATFYRMPTPKSLENWRDSTPENFRFAIKASQQITHRQRLRCPPMRSSTFTACFPTLGTKLGIVLYQLPPTSNSTLPGSRLSWALCPRVPAVRSNSACFVVRRRDVSSARKARRRALHQ